MVIFHLFLFLTFSFVLVHFFPFLLEVSPTVSMHILSGCLSFWFLYQYFNPVNFFSAFASKIPWVFPYYLIFLLVFFSVLLIILLLFLYFLSCRTTSSRIDDSFYTLSLLTNGTQGISIQHSTFYTCIFMAVLLAIPDTDCCNTYSQRCFYFYLNMLYTVGN